MSSRLHFQKWKRHHMVVQALEFELLAKDQEIWLREEYNIKFKHVEETLHAENA